MSYASDRQWGDSLIGEAVRLIAPHIIVPADSYRDRRHATDLVVLDTAKGGIAFRTRRAGYERRFGHQFTVRYSRDSGARTEFEKIMAGYADWMFYGHADGETFSRWMLLDLGVFRRVVATQLEHSAQLAEMAGMDGFCSLLITHNNDGTSFAVFDINDFPQELVIDQSQVSHERVAA